MTNQNSHPIPMDKLAAPAQRALNNAGYSTLEQFSNVSEKKLSTLHGIGPKAIDVLNTALQEHGMAFREQD